MDEDDRTRRVRFREGMLDGRWAVRRAAALGLMSCAEPADLPAFAALLHDPKVDVRHGVVVAIAVAFGRSRESDVIPLLVERALTDESLRVRRQAVSMLAWQLAHPDLESFFAELAERETDERLVRFARAGRHLARARAAREASLRPRGGAPC
jgi:HEAT repeat protein